jgi:hypothetical protein
MSISVPWPILIEGENIETYNQDHFFDLAYRGQLGQLKGYEDTHSRIPFRVFKVNFQGDIYYCLVLDMYEIENSNPDDRKSFARSFLNEFKWPDYIYGGRNYNSSVIFCWLIG